MAMAGGVFVPETMLLSVGALILKGAESGLALDKVKLEAIFFPSYTLDSTKPLIAKQ